MLNGAILFELLIRQEDASKWFNEREMHLDAINIAKRCLGGTNERTKGPKIDLTIVTHALRINPTRENGFGCPSSPHLYRQTSLWSQENSKRASRPLVLPVSCCFPCLFRLFSFYYSLLLFNKNYKLWVKWSQSTSTKTEEKVKDQALLPMYKGQWFDIE